MISSLKKVVRGSIGSLYHSSGLYKWCQQGRAVILAYHRILPRKTSVTEYVQPGMYVLDEVFDAHVKYIKMNFLLISMRELVWRIKGGIWQNNKTYCVITFDDGWKDNYDHGMEILRKHDAPACVFIPTGLIGHDQPFWQDRLCYLLNTQLAANDVKGLLDKVRGVFEEVGVDLGTVSNSRTPGRGDDLVDALVESCKLLSDQDATSVVTRLAAVAGTDMPLGRRLLNWREIEEMSGNGIEFGSHSCTHRILTQLEDADIWTELDESRKAITSRGVRYAPVFSYPNGSYDGRVKQVPPRCGYEAAVGMEYGVIRESTEDLYCLPRIAVHNDIGWPVSGFSLRVSGRFG